MEDEFILVPRPGNEQKAEEIRGHLADIDQFIRELEPSLWPLNTSIHDNPELGFKEYKTHDALTSFMQSREGWHITPSACGMETAWVAEYDSRKPGPVVSFNAEMGMLASG